MGRNNRPQTTVTRSVSFDKMLFDRMEADRKKKRFSRSRILREMLEEKYPDAIEEEPARYGASGRKR